VQRVLRQRSHHAAIRGQLVHIQSDQNQCRSGQLVDGDASRGRQEGRQRGRTDPGGGDHAGACALALALALTRKKQKGPGARGRRREGSARIDRYSARTQAEVC